MANEDEIVCNGRSIRLPSLEVVKTIPKMSAGPNIDWLLHVYFARKDFERCKVIIEKELYRHLNPEYLFFVKGLIDREEGNNIDALRNLQSAIELNPKNIEAYKEVGKTLFIMGRFNQALSVFREAEELSPRADHEIFHFIGELLHRSAAACNQLEKARQQEEEAKSYFQKAVQCGKKLESFQRLAEIHRKNKEYGKAIEVLENCLLLAPENTIVLTEIGVLYLKINETQKAFDRLLEVINVDKKCPRGLLAFGAILQSRNDIDGALGKYKQIAVAEPEIAELWNNIGLCFYKKQKTIVAISSLRKSVWLSPLNYNALYNLSLIYITAQQYASAFHTLAAAINLRKDSAECYMLLGICLRKLEDNQNAFTAFERSSLITSQDASSTRNPLIHLNFALFCYETGRLALATEQYNRFLSSSQDLLLPTEYKFQSTKLKSLLKISTSNILTSPTEAGRVAEVGRTSARRTSNVLATLPTTATNTATITTTTAARIEQNDNNTASNNGGTFTNKNKSQEKLEDNDEDADPSTAAAQPEIPLEVNAVVNAAGMPGMMTTVASSAAVLRDAVHD